MQVVICPILVTIRFTAKDKIDLSTHTTGTWNSVSTKSKHGTHFLQFSTVPHIML